MNCPKCGSNDVSVNTFQEDRGSITTSKTKSKYKEQGHGCLWWLTIGWWWWIVDLFLWIGLFPLRLLYELLRKRKYVGRSTTVSQSVNRIKYKTVCSCRACGNTWVQSEIESNPPPAGNRFMGLF